MRLSRWMLVLAVPLAGCEDLTGLTRDPDAPANLTYQLVPSGDPSAPLGVLLSWDMPRSGVANSFNVYGRATVGGAWHLRATTTSTTFHDVGVPELQYYVSACDIDANEIAESPVVTIDLNASRLPAPRGLTSVSLNGAIQLAWEGNAVQAGQGRFDHYRVYSTEYDGLRGVCTAKWSVEGSTVADAFYAGNLANGASRCFAVSAVTHDGHESVWSDSRLDTPRLDARNAFVYSTAARGDSSGFLFFDETSRRGGIVSAASRSDLDVTIERQSDGSLWFAPARGGVAMALYSSRPVTDLTSVDRAPSSGFGTARIEALPGYAYVFRVQKSDGVHYAAIRVVFTAKEYVVFDWSYQSSPGNAELNRRP